MYKITATHTIDNKTVSHLVNDDVDFIGKEIALYLCGGTVKEIVVNRNNTNYDFGVYIISSGSGRELARYVVEEVKPGGAMIYAL